MNIRTTIMNTERRTFIRGLLGTAAGLAAATLLGRPARALAGPFTSYRPAGAAAGNPLRMPGTFGGSTIAARVQTQEVWPGEEIPVWTIGGSYPGPTIRVRRGERFAVKFTNELPEETIIHWHGLVLPHDMDGHPMDAIGSGATYDYAFDVVNRAGTYWYHPHPHERTGPQIYMGMAGFLIVTDAEEEGLGLPSGEFDIPLLIQDRRAATTHRFDYTLTSTDHVNGVMGDTVLVNGTPDAFLEVSADLYRFRLLNASNARVMKIGFADGRKFHVIGTDGGLLDKPYEVESVLLGPAERIELLVDFSGSAVGESFELKTLRFSGATIPRNQGYEMPVIRFDVSRPAAASAVIPEALNPIERIDPSLALRTQRWELTSTIRAPHGETSMINGKLFDMHRIDALAGDGDVEIWEITSKQDMPHPMHIHGVQFQVLERIGGPEMFPTDRGWKDTVMVWRYETVRLIMRFGPHRGTYLIHCHNLEHEDMGMMLNYDVADPTSAVEGERSLPTQLDLR